MVATSVKGPLASGSEQDGPIPAEVLFGTTPEMARIRQTIERVAGVRVPVLISGESGTGKEALATYMHHHGPWAEGPLVKVNCMAIPGALLESEMFGYEKGAFTGAYAARAGKFEQGRGGTIVLDEIADIEGGLQAKLLQVLQDGTYSRIGDLEERRADVRIVCITNRDIEQEIARGAFREDLYYRINVVSVELPPLRQRRDDVPLLVDYFLKSYGARFNRRPRPLPGSVLERFRQHSWPGNIRELENFLKRYVILETADSILSELEESRRDARPAAEFELPPIEDFSLKKYARAATVRAERHLILEALKQTRWNRKRAAELLGISYRALLYKIKEAGLPQKKRPHENHTA